MDISATGMSLVASESLLTDEIVSVEVDLHLVLADVRYSLPRGSKFAIGVERVHSLPKLSLPEYKTGTEKIQALIDDFQLRLHDDTAALGPGAGKALAQVQRFQSRAGETPDPPVPAPSPAGAPLETLAVNRDTSPPEHPQENSPRDENIRRILTGLGLRQPSV